MFRFAITSQIFTFLYTFWHVKQYKSHKRTINGYCRVSVCTVTWQIYRIFFITVLNLHLSLTALFKSSSVDPKRSLIMQLLRRCYVRARTSSRVPELRIGEKNITKNIVAVVRQWCWETIHCVGVGVVTVTDLLSLPVFIYIRPRLGFTAGRFLLLSAIAAICVALDIGGKRRTDYPEHLCEHALSKNSRSLAPALCCHRLSISIHHSPPHSWRVNRSLVV